LYPSLLREIADPPGQLYVRGNIDILSHAKLLAVVGSRKANTYGQQCVSSLLPLVVRTGVLLVSGLAFGIDSLAHRACLSEGKPTMAVLGGGIDNPTIYPSAHLRLAHEILHHGGAIVAQYPPGTPAQKHHFPERNRIIAGLCQATLIVQAAARSGSLITARLALESNREVLAVPGPITDPLSHGTNDLIRQGAHPATRPQDILDVFDLDTEYQGDKPADNLTEKQQLIFQHVAAIPLHIDEITGRAHLPAEQVSATLMELELLNYVQHSGGMRYVRRSNL
jgi:DNA processing protein